VAKGAPVELEIASKPTSMRTLDRVIVKSQVGVHAGGEAKNVSGTIAISCSNNSSRRSQDRESGCEQTGAPSAR
jgi:hypothetical protein